MKYNQSLSSSNRNFRLNAAGFTIIELIVSVVIVGILSSISVPSIITWRRNQVLKGFTQTLRSEITLISEEAKDLVQHAKCSSIITQMVALHLMWVSSTWEHNNNVKM